MHALQIINYQKKTAHYMLACISSQNDTPYESHRADLAPLYTLFAVVARLPRAHKHKDISRGAMCTPRSILDVGFQPPAAYASCHPRYASAWRSALCPPLRGLLAWHGCSLSTYAPPLSASAYKQKRGEGVYLGSYLNQAVSCHATAE